MEISAYQSELDETPLMQMIEAEGEDWADYWRPESADRFKQAMEQSISHVAYEEEQLCGFIRSIDDYGLNILLMDLLVAPAHRGKGIGRKLIDRLISEYPDHEIYVLSDNDDYYDKQGFKQVGTVFDLKDRKF